jgi:hypothetical protein
MQQTGRRKCAAGTRCAARPTPRGGLFDIVKKDGVPTVLGRRRLTCDNGGGGGSVRFRYVRPIPNNSYFPTDIILLPD